MAGAAHASAPGRGGEVCHHRNDSAYRRGGSILEADSAGVWQMYPSDCGRHKTVLVEVVGSPVPPQRQYPYSKATEEGIAGVIDDLEKQGVLRTTHSPFNTPV